VGDGVLVVLCPCALQQRQDGSFSGLGGQLQWVQLMPAGYAGVSLLHGPSAVRCRVVGLLLIACVRG
jgi:hypothetical protein